MRGLETRPISLQIDDWPSGAGDASGMHIHPASLANGHGGERKNRLNGESPTYLGNPDNLCRPSMFIMTCGSFAMLLGTSVGSELKPRAKRLSSRT